MTPGRTSLAAIISGCGIALDPAQLDLLWGYHRMLRSANAELNLTRIHNFENMVLKHYVDSLLVLKYVDLPSPLIDMGSGPGLHRSVRALAPAPPPPTPPPRAPPPTRARAPPPVEEVARPGVSMILAEPPRAARASSWKKFAVDSNWPMSRFSPARSGRSSRERFGGLSPRAVRLDPGDALDRVGQLLRARRPDDLRERSRAVEAEIAEARSTHAESFRLVLDQSYQIPGTPHDRRLVVYEQRLEEVIRTRRGDASSYAGARPASSASESNPSYKLALDLPDLAKGIRKHGRALIAGPRVVSEVLQRFPERVEGWLTDSARPAARRPNRPTVARLVPAGRPPVPATLDVSGNPFPLLLVRVPEIPRVVALGRLAGKDAHCSCRSRIRKTSEP